MSRFCEWCRHPVADEAGPCPLSFACPTCDVPAGSPCRRPSGHNAAEMHAARRALEFQTQARQR